MLSINIATSIKIRYFKHKNRLDEVLFFLVQLLRRKHQMFPQSRTLFAAEIDTFGQQRLCARRVNLEAHLLSAIPIAPRHQQNEELKSGFGGKNAILDREMNR